MPCSQHPLYLLSNHSSPFKIIYRYQVLVFSVKFKVEPVSVSQINTYDRHKAENAIDGNLNTHSHTQCVWDTDLWYKMKFDAVYCFTEVIVVQSNWNNAERMDVRMEVRR